MQLDMLMADLNDEHKRILERKDEIERRKEINERVAMKKFRADEAHPRLCAQFGAKTLEGFGVADDDAALPGAGALVAYLVETQSVGDDPEAAVNTGDKWAASGGEFQGQRRTLRHLRPPARAPLFATTTTTLCCKRPSKQTVQKEKAPMQLHKVTQGPRMAPR